MQWSNEDARKKAKGCIIPGFLPVVHSIELARTNRQRCDAAPNIKYKDADPIQRKTIVMHMTYSINNPTFTIPASTVVVPDIVILGTHYKGYQFMTSP